jgi:hypothetical protein
MDRRNFLTIMTASALCASAVPALAAGNNFPNGRWDPTRKVFRWQKIGVDAFGAQPLQVALDLLNVPRTNQGKIIAAIEIRPGMYTTPNRGVQTIQRGHMYGAMVSGGITSAKAWATPNVMPEPDVSWSSIKIDVWVVWVDDKRYVLGRPHGCSNWIIMMTTNAEYYCPPPCCGN